MWFRVQPAYRFIDGIVLLFRYIFTKMRGVYRGRLRKLPLLQHLRTR